MLWSVDLKTRAVTLSGGFQSIYGHLGVGVDCVQRKGTNAEGFLKVILQERIKTKEQ